MAGLASFRKATLDHPSWSLTHPCSHFGSVIHCCVTSGSGSTSLFLGLPPGVCWQSELCQHDRDSGTLWGAPALGALGSRELAGTRKGEQTFIFTVTLSFSPPLSSFLIISFYFLPEPCSLLAV